MPAALCRHAFNCALLLPRRRRGRCHTSAASVTEGARDATGTSLTPSVKLEDSLDTSPAGGGGGAKTPSASRPSLQLQLPQHILGDVIPIRRPQHRTAQHLLR